ncbi:Delta endotoxin [Cordyceps fumosorosea ARSEF 2679]|uniref:Delta endotoxin n=1 Tax=Cordyceps fumosorosea (strain ARSEF 2679) TaxID=1081104 RepID=A0A167LRQ6_CORFA|nr:Delta endotoxin [Cordyceps fumosorosea ARSEF 2679]OAA53416.1 Delta endotoxin [Cordyceps fumosorosea ARSEF 2679]
MSLRFNEDMAWGLVNVTIDAAKMVTFNPEVAPPQSFHAIHMVIHSLSILSHLARPPAVRISIDVVLEVILLIITSIMSQSPWEQLRPIIELLGDSHVKDGDLIQFQERLQDIKTNVKHFKDVVRAHNDAPPSSRGESWRTVQHHYTGLLADMRDAIPHFQVTEKAVVSLPLFSAVANIQLLMLAEGIRSGESWGFAARDVRELFRGEFEERVGLGAKPPEISRRGIARRNLTASLSGGAARNMTVSLSKTSREKRQMELLSEAMAQGKASGWSPELLETWKRAYSARTVRVPAGREEDEYPRYARNKYDQGRTKVRPARKNYILGSRGWKNTRVLQPLAEYDAVMSMTALMYSEYWPYLVGDAEVPQRVLLKMDREIYAGPYGLWANAAEVPWSVQLPSPTRARPGRMASMVVRSDHIVNSVQVKFGDGWEAVQGNDKMGSSYLIDLDPDEHIHTVDVAGKFSGARTELLDGAWGRTIEALRFRSNKAAYGPYGRGMCTVWAKELARNASSWGLPVSRAGYRLSSVQLSRTLPASEPRLNSALGIILRPLKDRSPLLSFIFSFHRRAHCHESYGHNAVYFGFRSILLEAVPETPTNGTGTAGSANGTFGERWIGNDMLV